MIESKPSGPTFEAFVANERAKSERLGGRKVGN
jgi:hypothetical protein